jgi:hypothetical protein
MFWAFGIIASAALAVLYWTNLSKARSSTRSSCLKRSVRFLQVCLLIATILLISRLGLTWQSYSVDLTAGFGIYPAFDLALLEFSGQSTLHRRFSLCVVAVGGI